jgi:hypothetical protein
MCSDSDCIIYPTIELIKGNMFSCYDYRQSLRNLIFDGSIKCRGYHLVMPPLLMNFDQHPMDIYALFVDNPYFSCLLCTLDESKHGRYKDSLSTFQYNSISQYRIYDRINDYIIEDDQTMLFKNNYCTGNVEGHYFAMF